MAFAKFSSWIWKTLSHFPLPASNLIEPFAEISQAAEGLRCEDWEGRDLPR